MDARLIGFVIGVLMVLVPTLAGTLLLIASLSIASGRSHALAERGFDPFQP